MPASINQIIFDEESFPLSPRMERVAVEEYDDFILARARGLKEMFRQYSTVLPEAQKVRYRGVPAANYVMRVSMRGPQKDPILSFHIVNPVDLKVHSSVNLHLAKFHADYAPALIQRMSEKGGLKSEAEAAEFETDWSARYLRTHVFKERLSGSKAFWREFVEQIDLATVPAGYAMVRAMQGAEEKPIRAHYDGPV